MAPTPELELGWLSLLAPAAAIVLALATRQVLVSLFVAVWLGATLLAGGDPLRGFLDLVDHHLVPALASPWNAAVVLFTLSVGGMLGVMARGGATSALAGLLTARARSPRGLQLTTVTLGIVVFFDGLANTMVVGPSVRPASDRLRVSREKLAFLVDATSAPVVGMALISTWVGYELGLLRDILTTAGVSTGAYQLYLHMIPNSFYNVFLLGIVLAVAAGGRDLGPMLAAERRARQSGAVLREGAQPLLRGTLGATPAERPEPTTGTGPAAVHGAWLAVGPIVLLLVAVMLGLWFDGAARLDAPPERSLAGLRAAFGAADASIVLLWSALGAGLAALVAAVVTRRLTLRAAVDAWVAGASDLLVAVVVLALAWSLGSVVRDAGAAAFLAQAVGAEVDPGWLPAVVFLVSCVLAFATGTSWGTMAVMLPLVGPLALATPPAAADPLLAAPALSAVLSGAIFGDHCSPISDTTVMSSLAAGADHVDHVRTQIPYALLAAACAVVAYVVQGRVGIGTAWLLPAGTMLAAGLLLLVGRPAGEAPRPAGD
jgi:Na+/H+ antiporter NhaC